MSAGRAARSRKRAQLGFTLMELMIVVIIMGILATLAGYSMVNYINKSKTAEAREVVAAIMAGQEAFFDETSQYLDVTGGVGNSDFYPAGTFNGQTVIQWGADDACSGLDLSGKAATCAQNFRTLGVHVATPVRFRYASTTVDVGKTPSVPGVVSGFNPSGVTATKAGYVVVAMSDLDGDGGKYSKIVGSSLQADLYVEDPGE